MISTIGSSCSAVITLTMTCDRRRAEGVGFEIVPSGRPTPLIKREAEGDCCDL